MPAVPSLTSPSGLNHAAGFNDGKHYISVVDKDNPSIEIGTVTVSGISYNAVIPFTSLNRYAMLVVKDRNGRTLYKNMLGRLLKTEEVPTSINLIRISSVKIDETSTARAAFGLEKGLPDTPFVVINSSEYSQQVIYRDYSSASPLATQLEILAGGSNNLTQAANAILTIAAVLNSNSLSDAIKTNIAAPSPTAKITDILLSFVKALKDDSARQFINNASMASSVSIDGRAISQSSSESEVADIISHVKPSEILSAPVITPNGATGLTAPASVTITAVSGASIRYTTDGPAPSLTNGLIYSGPINISSNTTLKAAAIKNGALSSISTAIFSFSEKASNPLITPAGGNYTTAQNITISNVTPGAIIKYTTDGTAPSLTNGMTYSASIMITSSTTLKAIAIKTGMANSDVVAENYIITQGETLAPPSFNPAGGNFTAPVSVTMTTTAVGAAIKYTTDGTNPSAANGFTYSGPVTVGVTTTLKAVVIKNSVISSVTSHTYTVTTPVAMPVITPAGGSHLAPLEITITCATPGASIFYTDNGTAPTISSDQYNSTQKITINQSKTIKAIAAKSGTTTGTINYSEIATADFNILQKAGTPYFQPAGGTYSGSQQISILCATPGAEIYYTTNGSEPSEETAVKYNGAITVGSSMTIKAIAGKNGMGNSDVATAVYVINPAVVNAPEFNLSSGTYNEPKYIQLSCTTSGASIYYTLDGSEPSASSSSSKLYTSPTQIYIDSSAITEVKAIAIKSGMQNSSVTSRAYRVDRNAALFNIQYYSDSSLSASLGDKPYLKAGTYYLKISASKPLKQAPTVTIEAEGNSNDVINATSTLYSGNDYRFTRTIIYDSQAAGNYQESISISSIDANDVSSEGVKPMNEAAKAAFTDTVAPAANMIYNTWFPVKQGVSISITANLTEDVLSTTPLKISLSGANALSAVSMTKINTSQYQYSYTTQSGNGFVNIALSGATDKAGNAITSTPVSGFSFELDNSVPPQPGNITITPVGGEIRTNTLNSTNTNMTVTANIDSSKTVGGYAELYIGNSNSPIATDSSIISGDSIVNFNCGTNTTASLQTSIPTGGEVRVRLYNKAGSYTDSVGGPYLTVDYTPPAAPVISNTYTATGGTVISSKINSTNTNFTLSASITPNDATGGKARLYIKNSLVTEYSLIASGQSVINFKALETDSASYLRSAIPAPGGNIKVRLYDSAGNYTDSTSNYSIAASYEAPQAPSNIVLTPAGGTVVSNTLNSTNTNLTATAAIAGTATDGRAELYIGATKIAEDNEIGATDTGLNFDCGAASEYAIQSKVPSDGASSVKLYDAYGNVVTSANGPTLTVRYNKPAAPSAIAIIPEGGIIVANRLNSSNTNLKITATIDASAAPGGTAELSIGSNIAIKSINPIGAGAGSVEFNFNTNANAALKAAITSGGVVVVKLYDIYGNTSYKEGVELKLDWNSSAPVAPSANNLNFNCVDNKVYFKSNINGSANYTDANNKLTLYVKIKRGLSSAVYKYNSAFADNNAGSYTFNIGANADQFSKVSGDILDSPLPKASDELEYAVADSYGNMSGYTADGAIPAAPVVTAAGLDNRDGKITIGDIPITSLASNSKIYVYYADSNIGTGHILHNYTVDNVLHNGTTTPYTADQKTGGWQAITAGKHIAYAIEDTASGNVSALTYRGTVPAPPDVTKIGYSRAGTKSTVSQTDITTITNTSAVLSMWQVADANNGNPAAKGTKTGVDLSTLTGDLITETIAYPNYVAYTITDENGNISAFVNDGQVPDAPAGGNIKWSDAKSEFKPESQIGSEDTLLRVYRKNAANDYSLRGRAVNSINQDKKGDYKQSTTVRSYQDNSAIKIYNADGDKVNYTLINNSGNESDYADGDLVPNKPDVTKLAYSKAAKKTTVLAGVVNVDEINCILECYQSENESGSSGIVAKGMKTANFKTYTGVLQEDQNIDNDKFILYTFMNSAGNTSAYASDGKVPVAPTQDAVTASTFSNASGDINIKATAFTTLTTNTRINVYEDNDGTYDTVNSIKKNRTALANNSGINVTKAATDDGLWSGTVINAAHVGYTIETADGNESNVIFDANTIPAAPGLPLAATLILQAGDGGTDAPAGYVNDAGKTSVTLRPGIALLTNEKVTLKVFKTNSAIMTATASAGAIPIFGTAPVNVTFANVIANSGDTTNGKFNFTTAPIAESAVGVADIAVTATKTAADGNESAWSAIVNITYDKTAPTLSFSQASYIFAGTGAKTFNLTASKTLRANNAGLLLAGIHSNYCIETFTVAGWTTDPAQFKVDDFISGTAVTITSDALANDTDAGSRTKPTFIKLGAAGMAVFKDLAGNKLTTATVTVNP
jgi:hypothetical protein